MKDIVERMTHGFTATGDIEDMLKWDYLTPTQMPDEKQQSYCAAALAGIVSGGKINERAACADIIEYLESDKGDIRKNFIDLCWKHRTDNTPDVEVVAKGLLGFISSSVSSEVMDMMTGNNDIPDITTMVEDGIRKVIKEEYQELLFKMWSEHTSREKPPVVKEPEISLLIYYLLINNI